MLKAESTTAREIEGEAAAWLARADRGLSEAEENDFQQWIESDLRRRTEWLRLSSVWRRADRLGALRAAPGPRGSLGRRGGAELRLGPRRWQAAVAAGLAGVVLLTGGVAKVFLWGETLVTPVGGMVIEPLSDGSRIELNTSTRARLAVNGLQRRVWLDRGEAFFDVQRDPSRPFIVAAGDVRVSVVGTAFVVEREGGSVTVRVTEGLVQVQAGQRAVSARPGDEVVIRDGQLHYARRDLQAIEDELGWRTGRLIFHDRPLEEVAAQFNRYNQRKIRIEGAAKSLRVGGSFKADNVDAFAAVLENGYGLKVRRHANEINIVE
ncbi:fec operon regulator FecR [compost metagenome]